MIIYFLVFAFIHLEIMIINHFFCKICITIGQITLSTKL